MAAITLRELLHRIEQHGGPEGLDLERADLSGLDAGPQALAAEAKDLALGAAAPVWIAPQTGGLNLAGASLERANLVGARLQGANLRLANLERADLRSSLLDGASLTEANLERARLDGASLCEANLERANLERAEAQGAVLRAAMLGGSNLERATLHAANLAEATLPGANLEGADIGAADLTRAMLAGANLEGVHAQGACLAEADLSGALLEDANLMQACLRQANLRSTDLSGAYLDGADLHGACLAQADLRGAHLDGTNLEGADLSGAMRDETSTEEAPAEEAPGSLAARIAAGVGTAIAQVSQMAGTVAEAARRARAAAGELTGDAEEFSLALPLEGAAALQMTMPMGNVEVNAEDRHDILLRGRGASADALQTQRAGDVLQVDLQVPGPTGILPFAHGRVDLVVAVPRTLARVGLETGGGNLRLRGVEGTVKAHTGGGNVDVDTGDARAIAIDTGGGNIDIRAGRMEALTANTGGGNVTIVAGDTGTMEVRTGGGNVSVSGGRLGRLALHTGAGNLTVSLLATDGDCRCETGAGNVTVHLPGDAAAQIEAVTGMGQVRSDWPLVRVGRPGPAAFGSARMVGAIGEESRRGRLEVRTGIGDIRLRRVSERAAVPTEMMAASAPAGHGTEPEAAMPTQDGRRADSDAADGTDEAADARLEVLQSLARGEISVEEANALLLALEQHDE